MNICRVTVIAVVVFFMRNVRPSAAEELDFQKQIVPILNKRCVNCHGAELHEAKVDFSRFADDCVPSRHRKLWRKAITRIEAGEMPPASEPPIAPEEKQQLLRWMKQTVEVVDCNDPINRDPGPSLLRRLSLVEYNQTIRDLLGFEYDASAVGMPEELGEGNPFGNLAGALDISPPLMEKYFTAADQILDRFFGTELSSSVDGRIQEQARVRREQLFNLNPGTWRKPDYEVAPPQGVTPQDAAHALLRPFLRQAYRGQQTTADAELLLAIFDQAQSQGTSYGDSVRWMFKAILVSPKFLYRVEANHPGRSPGEVYPVSDHELAVRLAYFLWSSMPDEELMDLAERKQLTAVGPSNGTVLEQQVRRMLADPRAKSLTDTFALHWLQIHKLPTARPSTEFFPEFHANLRQAMFDETALFCETIRREDRSLLEFLDADYTFANEELARYYGLSDVTGKELRRVSLLPEHHRGGLLGMGSVLALTSHTSRTSPTLRGKWILEVLLGAPPPPPPANVSQIKDEPGKPKEIQTFRDKLLQHAENAACTVCHRKMDPLGFALDHFDAVGRWRQKAGDQPLDVSGELPTGEKLNGVSDLKQVLLLRKFEFAENLTERMLSYALGRELDDYDDCSVQQISSQLQQHDYRYSVLVMEIVKSFPFQHRKQMENVLQEPQP